MINSVIVIGRLVADPELKYAGNDTPVCTIRLAVDRDYKKDGQQNADFFDVVGWRSTAEFMSKYFVKGQMIAVDGRLQSRTWKDNEGKTKSAVEIIAEKVSFCGDKGIREAGDAKRAQVPHSEGVDPYGRGGGECYSGDQYGSYSQTARKPPESDFSALSDEEEKVPWNRAY